MPVGPEIWGVGEQLNTQGKWVNYKHISSPSPNLKNIWLYLSVNDLLATELKIIL